MPDPPPPKHRVPVRSNGRPPSGRPIRYAELHCRTNFSFLRGAAHPEELVRQATDNGYAALAVTDRHSVAGVVRAHTVAREAGLKLLIGAEIVPADAPPAVLLATDRAAYGRLTRLITCGCGRAPKGECHLMFEDLADHADGLLAGVLLPAVIDGLEPLRWLHAYRDVFGDRCYGLIELHRGPDDPLLLERMTQWARPARLPLAAANDVHYHIPQRRYLQDVLTAIRHGCSVSELGARIFPNGERSLKTPQQMAELFHAAPELIARTVEIADRCTFSLDELRYDYPEELCPPGTTPMEHLRHLTWDGAHRRYPAGVPDKIRGFVEHELRLIEELHYEAYFLTVWDLVRFARSRGILCQGRGSAANSTVCFCLGVTSVDPGCIDLLFERFVSKERNEAPDIDLDFEHERREEVLQYIYAKYGRERAGMTAEIITYRPRSAVRDVGRALGLSPDRIDRLAKSLDPHSEPHQIAACLREAGLDPASRLTRQLLHLVRELLGFPRHLSQHVGGMVITRQPLCELVPIENAAMPGRTVIQWDKDDLDALGILKVDCLALGMLTALRKGFELVERHWGRRLTLADIPADEAAVYEMIGRADTVGVFQIESRGQMAMLPRLKPREFYDLVIEVAIVRPGPIQGNMVHPYLRRRCGEELVQYPDERIRDVLEKTLGVPIFQEQCMRLAVVAAGFTPGEADQLRRAMAAWKRSGTIERFRHKLLDGMQRNGYPVEFAERIFRQIRGFGEYGFPESHAASFALLAYASAWLKCHYPAAFTAALLNSQPMGFYAPAQLVSDLRRHGVTVRPVDVHHSGWDCCLEATMSGAWALRLGFRMIKGLTPAHAETIVRCRAERPFQSFADFTRRTGLSSVVLQRLSSADALRSLKRNRRSALWDSLPEQMSEPLLAAAAPDEPPAPLPPMVPLDEVIADYRTTGLSLRNHPMAFVRSKLDGMPIATAAELAHRPADRRCRVAGLVLLRQRPGSARGVTFVTLEDETGTANLLIRPDVWERFRPTARTAPALLVRGLLQREHGVIHVLVDWMQDLSRYLSEIPSRSRDFR